MNFIEYGLAINNQRTNYYRCTKDDPVPVESGIPLVEFHAAGGRGDNQQVKLLSN